MPQPEVHRATPADAAALARLAAETFTETFGRLYPPEDLAAYLESAYDQAATRARLADHRHAAWISRVGGEDVGYAEAGPCALPHPEATPQCGELKRIYVRQGFQNLQLGARLFDAALAWLEATRPNAATWIGVWSENHGAQRFYARRGFRTVGEYGFKVGATVDRELILRKDP